MHFAASPIHFAAFLLTRFAARRIVAREGEDHR
jgi:hypothetical protein